MNVLKCITAVSLVWLTLFAESALATPTIDCDRTINDQAVLQGAINLATRGSTVRVKGTCEGVVLEITKPGITLAGPAEIVGRADSNVIVVRDGDGVTLRNLTVSGGTIGLAVDNSRVLAVDFVAEHNSVYGIWSVGNGNLACVNCQANSNGTGLLTTGYLSLCGNSQFNDNTADGMFGFMGAQIFSIKSVCGDAPSVAMRNNGLGLHLFGNASMFVQQAEVDVSQNRGVGILAFDNVVLTMLQTDLVVSSNLGTGLSMGASTATRLNDAAGGTTTIANNGSIGLYISQNGQMNAQNITLSNNGFRDAYVADFSVAQFGGASTPGAVFCEPGQSSGSFCP